MCNKRKIRCLFLRLLVLGIIGILSACSGEAGSDAKAQKTISVNNNQKGKPVKKAPAGKAQVEEKPTIDVYLENSGSMDGYINAMEFKNIVYGYLSDIAVVKNNGRVKDMNLFYVNSKVLPQNSSLDLFIKSLTVANFKKMGGGRGSTDVAQLLDTVVRRTGKEKVSILISDFIFSPGKGKDAEQYLENQKNAIKIRMADKLNNDKDFAVCVYKFEAMFDGFYYDKEDKPKKIKESRPFYIWLMGSKGMIKKLKEAVPDDKFGTKLKESYVLEPMGQTVKSSCSPGGKVTINTSGMLQDKAYLCDVSNYKVGSGNIKLKSAMMNAKGNTILTCEKTLGIALTSKCTLMSKVPQWVYSSHDDIGESAVSQKTYGLKYLIEGVYDAFTFGSKSYFEVHIKF